MKKTIVMLLAFCMLLSLLAGCGAPAAKSEAASAEKSAASEPTQEPAPAPDTAPEAEPEPAEPEGVSLPLSEELVEVTGWTGWAAALDNFFTISEKHAFVELENRTNVHVEWTTNSTMETAATSLSILAASGDYYDVYEDLGSYYPGGYATAYSDEFIIDLSEYKDDMPNLYARFEENELWKRGSLNDNGQLLFAPSLISNKYGTAKYDAMLARGDWMESLNIKTPETYEQFYEMLKAFKSEYNAGCFLCWNGTGVSNTLAAGYDTYVTFVAEKGAAYQPFFITEDGEVRCGFYNVDGTVDYYTMLNKWFSEGLIYNDFMTITPTTYTEDEVMFSGKVGVFYDHAINVGSKLQNFGEGARIVALPDVGKDGIAKTGLDGVGEGLVVNGVGTCISPQSEYIDILVRWKDYIYSDDGVILFNYGVEGDGFEYVDGKPQYTEQVVAAPMPFIVSLQLYANWQGACVLLDDRTDVTGSLDALYSVWSQNTTDRVYPTDVTFTPEEADDFLGIWSDVITCISENAVKFVIGERGIDEFEDFWGELKGLGIEDAIALKQTAYDRYLQR